MHKNSQILRNRLLLGAINCRKILYFPYCVYIQNKKNLKLSKTKISTHSNHFGGIPKNGWNMQFIMKFYQYLVGDFNNIDLDFILLNSNLLQPRIEFFKNQLIFYILFLLKIKC